MLLTLVVAAALTAPPIASADAPVSQVTVYSDRARVTRSASIEVSGTTTVELPLLQQSIDPASVRVEATGAEVRRVDLKPASDEQFPTDEARKLLNELRAAEDGLAKSRAEKAAHDHQLGLLQRVRPVQPTPEPQRNVPKLNGSGWGTSAAFIATELSRLQEKSRLLAVDIDKQEQRYQELTAKAQLLGGVQRRQGFRIIATLVGSGTAKVNLVYVTARARWYPLYELQLVPDTGKVQITFSGLVSQETGEDWTDAKLTLSTAMPAMATVFPKIATWKIGDKERFIPTPYPVAETVKPPPHVPPLPRVEKEEDLVRAQLLAEIGQVARPQPKQLPKRERAKEVDFSGDEVEGSGLAYPQGEAAPEMPIELEEQADYSKKGDRRPPPPPPAPMRQSPGRYERESASVPAMGVAESVSTRGSDFFGDEDKAHEPTQGVSLAPPRGFIPPPPPPDSPAALAGGYDLAFASLRPESVGSGKGSRLVPLFNEAWPVSVERKLFPGVAKEAYLVAEIKSPASKVLPAGNATLFVGEDPAGNARLPLVSPGEAFTLPLGLDRALKPVRNVKVTQAEKGIIGKEEITEYVVTTELSNPHSVPVSLRVFDQWPIASSKGLESKLLKTEPYAIQDQTKGTLEWRITLAPKQKKSVSFTYTLRRPKGWRLYQ